MLSNKRTWLLFAGLVVSGLVAGAGDVSASPPGGEEPAAQSPRPVSENSGDVVDGEYVVILEPSAKTDPAVQSQSTGDLHARVERVMNELASGVSGDVTPNATTDEVIGELGVIDGFGARLSPESAERLAELPGVAGVYPNAVVTADALTEDPPWGLDRIDQKSLPLDGSFTPPNDGSGVHIYIVDQAISPSHAEFARGLGKGVDLIGPPLEGECYRHGTHVAGTAGGAKVGVARAATMHSVRVLNCQNFTDLYTLIRGLDWVANNAVRPAVVNMSLAGRGIDEVATTAVDRLAALGITSVVSAANQSEDACLYSPASAPRAITVAASDENDVAADFSNFGPCVDLYAPGVRVTSADYSDPNSYFEWQGTSMAAPHVTGAVATYLHTYPDATPAQVHEAIVRGAVRNQLTDVPAKTPNRLLNVQALPKPGGGGPVLDGPVASISPVPDLVKIGTKLVFDATGSVDPGGSALSYEWSLDDSRKVVSTKPTFEYWCLERATHQVNLKVTNAAGQSDTTSFPVNGDFPGASAEPVVRLEPTMLEIAPGRKVTLDARASYSPIGAPLTYRWELIDNEGRVIAKSDGPTWTYAFPKGDVSYTVELFATDAYGVEASALSFVEVSSSQENRAVIVPGETVTVPVGTRMTFDGSLSGLRLGSPAFENRTFQWTLGYAEKPIAKGPKLTRTFDTVGQTSLELVVNATNGDGSPAGADVTSVYIDVVKSAPPAIKLAPSSQVTVEAGQAVVLSAVGSRDPDGGPLKFAWTASDAPSAVASNDVVFGKMFKKQGEYQVTLQATDDEGQTTTKSVAVTVTKPTFPPVASFTPRADQRILVGQSLNFDGSRSKDPDGGAVKFEWRSTGVSGVASKTSKYSRKFTKPGRYGVELTVIDDEGQSAKQRINVWVAKSEPPSAEFTPGTEQRIVVGKSLSFDGSRSNDPDGGAVRFEWRSTGVSGLASKTSKYSRKFTKPGRYGVQLTVIDDEGDRSTKRIDVWVAKSEPPVAEFTPGKDQRVDVGTTVSFDGSKSKDPDGGAVRFEWRSTGVSGLASKTSKYSRKFTKPGRYGVQLTVIDDEGDRSTKRIDVWVAKPVPPVAEFTPGKDQRVSVGATLSFNGSASKDPDGGAVRFEWRSTGVSGLASKASSYSRVFTKPGRYGVELTVIDDEGQSTRKHINVWVS